MLLCLGFVHLNAKSLRRTQHLNSSVMRRDSTMILTELSSWAWGSGTPTAPVK
jgi:hypothetical protein